MVSPPWRPADARTTPGDTSDTEATGTGSVPRPHHLDPAPERGAESTSAYRPELQGLRALAVTLVVLYHVWFGRVSGGVDVFFVITGFLLTGQLVRAASLAPLQIVRRWRRTVVRLTPAAFTVLVGTMVGAAIVLPEGRWPQTVREIIASALFVENWRLSADSVDYAARSNAVSVVQHFWSLSIQGQFSLVWPLLIALVALVARGVAARLHTQLTITLLGIFAASLTYSVALTAADQPFAYFNSLTRLWEFALGGLLALWIDRIRISTALRVAAGWIGVVGLISCGIVLQVDSVFPGFVALWPTSCAALVLIAGHTRFRFAADRLLASRGARYLGDISYALYLWHWPLLVLCLGGGGLDGVGVVKGTGIIALAVLLALLTHHYVEKPLLARRDDGRAVRLCAIGLVVVIGLAGVWQLGAIAESEAAGVVGDPAHPGALALNGRPIAEAPLLPTAMTVYEDFVQSQSAGWDCPPLPEYPAEDMCTQPVDYQPVKRIVVVGDSHAQQFTGVLIPLAEKHHWQLTTILRGACPFSTTSDTDPGDQSCLDWNKAAFDEIAELHPDAVVTIGSHNVRAGLTEETPPGFVEAWRHLDEIGIPVVAVRDNPRFSYSIPDCVSNNGRDSTECGVPRDQVYTPAPPWERIPNLPGNVRFVDLADAVCDQVRCPAEVGNVLVYLDDNHLSAAYASTMAAPLEPKILAALGW